MAIFPETRKQFSETSSDYIKRQGIPGGLQALANLTGEYPSTLSRWYTTRPVVFQCLVKGAKFYLDKMEEQEAKTRMFRELAAERRKKD